MKAAFCLNARQLLFKSSGTTRKAKQEQLLQLCAVIRQLLPLPVCCLLCISGCVQVNSEVKPQHGRAATLIGTSQGLQHRCVSGDVLPLQLVTCYKLHTAYH
jgi:hypothetical protein